MQAFLFDSRDSSWNTLSGVVSGWLDDDVVNVEISVDADRRWKLGGALKQRLSGVRPCRLRCAFSREGVAYMAVKRDRALYVGHEYHCNELSRLHQGYFAPTLYETEN